MTESVAKKSLYDLFLELPEKIREWLTSERATYTVIEINKRLGLFGEDLKIIPRLIARFVVKDLPPENFIKELAEQLLIEQDAAETMAQDIVQRIFRPIDLSLKEIGVFSALIFAKPQPSFPSTIPSSQPSESPLLETAVPPLPPAPPPVTPPAPAKPAPPLIATREAAHPSVASAAADSVSVATSAKETAMADKKAMEGKPQEQRQAPTPPPVPTPPKPPTIKAEPTPKVNIPVNVKKSKVIWGSGQPNSKI